MGTSELGAVIDLDRGRPGRALTRMVLRGRALATAASDAPPIDGQASLLGDVMAALQLDAHDQDLICVVLAAHLDPDALDAIAAHAGEPVLTIAGAAKLLGQVELPLRCLADSALRRSGLVELVLPAPGVSSLRAKLAPSLRLLALARGAIELAPAVADVATLVPAHADAAAGVACDPLLDDLVGLARSLQAARRQRGPLALLGQPMTGRLRTALAIAARTGRDHVIAVDARMVAADAATWRTLAGHLVTESTLHVAPVVIREPGPAGIAAAWRIARAGVPCMFTGDADVADSAARVVARIARPSGATQRAAWTAELARAKLPAVDTASLPPLTRSEIATAVALAERAPAGEDPAAWLGRCAKSQLHSRLDRFARPITRRVRLSELVLSPEVKAQIAEFIAALRARPQLDAVWGLGKILEGRAGVAALFEGPPGTGKTMCAAVVATELDVPLYRIDVSSIVDRYVGETEKNLQRVFREAAMSSGILLFDEADSLFGKRVETKDAMDRFANQQVNQLLNLIEDHAGFSILTTNHRQGIDTAFARRIPYKVSFELPELDERIALWRMYLPKGQLHDEVIVQLAERYDRVSGAEIRNAVIRAASRAITTRRLTPVLLSDALVAEIHASGRIARAGI